MIDILSEEFRRNPYPAFDRFRETSPVMKIPQGDLWLVLDYESVKRALPDHESFSNDASAAKTNKFEWLLFLDPPRHTQARAAVSDVFTPAAMAELEPTIRALAFELLDRFSNLSIDAVAEFSGLLPFMVISKIMGLPQSDLPKFKLWSEAILDLSYTVAGGEDMREVSLRFLAANEEMRAYLGDPDIEHLRFFQLLLVAGTETTTNLINNALLCFAEHPDQFALLKSNPALWPSAIEEVLRYRSPLQAAFRRTKFDVQIHGVTIPADSFVLLMIGSANRDRNVFSDADTFDIERNPNPHLAFGHGLHFCLGAALARLEARIALTALFSRFSNFELASDQPWTPRKAFHVHGPASLPIRLFT